MPSAWSIKVQGAVQGVGFRPFVYRLARANSLFGWVLNGEEGVEIFLEGADQSFLEFMNRLTQAPPPAAQIAKIEVLNREPAGLRDFAIRESTRNDRPTVRILADLPVCDECVRELFDPADRRYHYPYINCTMCGPRFTVIQALPYDRPEYHDAGLAAVRSLRRRVSRSGQPALSCAAGRLPGVRARIFSAEWQRARLRKRSQHSSSRGSASRGQDLRGEGSWRLPSGLRCAKCARRRRPSRAKISQGKTVCA